MAKRTPTGKARVGEQRNQSNILTGVTTLTASKVIDLGRLVKRRGASAMKTEVAFEVIGLTFEDVGGAAAETAQRLSSKKNADGTFTIYAEKADFGGTAWIAATGTQTVRWTVLVTS